MFLILSVSSAIGGAAVGTAVACAISHITKDDTKAPEPPDETLPDSPCGADDTHYVNLLGNQYSCTDINAKSSIVTEAEKEYYSRVDRESLEMICDPHFEATENEIDITIQFSESYFAICRKGLRALSVFPASGSYIDGFTERIRLEDSCFLKQEGQFVKITKDDYFQHSDLFLSHDNIIGSAIYGVCGPDRRIIVTGKCNVHREIFDGERCTPDTCLNKSDGYSHSIVPFGFSGPPLSDKQYFTCYKSESQIRMCKESEVWVPEQVPIEGGRCVDINSPSG
jgi:hypothetical protein